MSDTTHRALLWLDPPEAPRQRFMATVPSGKLVFDHGPDGEGPTPVDAVLAALGACAGIDVIGILRKKRQAVMGYEIVVEGERRAEHPRIFTKIEVLHRVRGRDLSPAAIEEAIRLSETKYCSVHAMLAPSAAIHSRYEIVPA